MASHTSHICICCPSVPLPQDATGQGWGEALLRRQRKAQSSMGRTAGRGHWGGDSVPAGLSIAASPQRNFLYHTTEHQAWLNTGALGLSQRPHPQSLAPVAAGPLQSGWMASVTCLSSVGKGGSGMWSKTLHLPSDQPEGRASVHGFKATALGPPVLCRLPMARGSAQVSWGFRPSVGMSSLGPPGCPRSEGRWHLPLSKVVRN